YRARSPRTPHSERLFFALIPVLAVTPEIFRPCFDTKFETSS
ncbi:MAG: hypothetical protein ACI9XK_005081, partial [Granulosicoccus sp.]